MCWMLDKMWKVVDVAKGRRLELGNISSYVNQPTLE